MRPQSTARLGLRIDLATLSEYDANGFLGVQYDSFGDQPAGVEAVEALHPFGFISRPLDPDVDENGDPTHGCVAVTLWDGDEVNVLLLSDARVQPRVPPLNKGSCAQYCGSAAPSFDMHDGADGTKTIYVEVGDSAHVITVGYDGNGDTVLSIVHADGMAVLLHQKKAIIKNAAGDCYIELNDSGGTLNGNWKVVGDISDSNGVSLLTHIHGTGVGPAGPPLPGGV